MKETQLKIDIERLARRDAAALVQNKALGLTGITEDDIVSAMLLKAIALKDRVADCDANEQLKFFSRVFGIVRKRMIDESLAAMRATAPAMYLRYLEEKRNPERAKTGLDRLKRLDEIQRSLARDSFYVRADSARRARRLEHFERTLERLSPQDRAFAEFMLELEANKTRAAALLGLPVSSFERRVFKPFAARFRALWRSSDLL